MKRVKVALRPIARQINLPTVIKTAVPPGDSVERLFIATQVGEIYTIANGRLQLFLDIRPQTLKLGASGGGYDERGLLGLAFHPLFYYNGLFYLHYSVAGTQGPGALSQSFEPNPCNPNTLNVRWENRESQFDHIDTVEEWILQPNGTPLKRRTLLNLRRPFFNHNGVNSLNFSPETGKLVLTTGDGGSGYDPFNLSQIDLEIAGKIFEIDVERYPFINNLPTVTRFDELPLSIQETLTVIAKGVRNIPGIHYQRFQNQFIKYVGNVGQSLVESIFSFVGYKPVPVTELVQGKKTLDRKGFINLGWRGWEGSFPTPVMRDCGDAPNLDEKTVTFYDEAVALSARRLQPLATYFHQDERPNKFSGTALTGLQPYSGQEIPNLTGSVLFSDFSRRQENHPFARGVLAYTRVRLDGQQNDYRVIEIDYDFGPQASHFVSLGTNMNQTKVYLGVYGSPNVTELNRGSIFEIIPSR